MSTVVVPAMSVGEGPPVDSFNGSQKTAAAELQAWVPSQFNARTTVPDGTLVIWNSYSNAFSGFPPHARSQVEALLRRDGFTAPRTGLTKYMADRGFIVPRGANEYERFRYRYGQRHYRQDRLELTIMASEECNFRCIYCYEKFARGTMEPWVRNAVIRMVEQRAPHLRTFLPGYFGGEPLMGFEAIAELAPAFLRLAEQHHLDFHSGMTTNAYLLTPDIFEKLLEWKVTRYQITLDGLPEDHDNRRVLKGGGPTFTHIFENLKRMQTFKTDFHVLLRVNFDPASAPRMSEFVSMMSVFKEDKRFELFFYPIRQLGGANDANLKVCGEIDPERDILETLGREKGMQVSRTVADSAPFGVPCYANQPYHIIIGVSGSIMKCTVMLDSGKKNIVGRLREDGSLEMDIDRFAAWCAPHFADDPQCRRCFFLPVCAGALCPAKRVVSGKRLCPPDKMRIGGALKKIWVVNHAKANRYDLRSDKLMRFDELPDRSHSGPSRVVCPRILR